jgi:uncharacterized membrane protein
MDMLVSSGSSRVSMAASPAGVRLRVQSLDILRGLVMIIMSLDHVRDFLHGGAQHFDPADVTRTTPALFFTRCITHFCAPTFMFLAGAGAYLQLRRGKSKPALARFLVSRGLWLVFLELTWVLCLGWKMNLAYDQIFFWVIWALGVSMIALAGLIFVPWRLLLAVSLAVIVLHNALDTITPAQLGAIGWLWKILHVLDTIPVSSRVTILINYPLLPWIFVMSAGYCFGRVMDLDSDDRKQFLMRLGAALTAGFVVLRWTNLYGDMHPRASQPSLAMTVASFLNVTKYLPSLLYLLISSDDSRACHFHFGLVGSHQASRLQSVDCVWARPAVLLSSPSPSYSPGSDCAGVVPLWSHRFHAEQSTVAWRACAGFSAGLRLSPCGSLPCLDRRGPGPISSVQLVFGG